MWAACARGRKEKLYEGKLQVQIVTRRHERIVRERNAMLKQDVIVNVELFEEGPESAAIRSLTVHMERTCTGEHYILSISSQI